MPIVGVPIPQPGDDCCDPASTAPAVDAAGVISGSAAAECSALFQLQPTLQQYGGTVLLSRLKTLSLRARQQTQVPWTLTTPDGRAVDLSLCICEAVSVSGSSDSDSADDFCGYEVKARMREQLGVGDCYVPLTEIPVTVVSASAGTLLLDFNRKITANVGIYFVEIAIVGTGPSDPDDPDSPEIEYTIFSNTLQVAISEGAWSAEAGGPPSIAEIRLWLRDTHPAESRLLSSTMFADDEIMAALNRVVMEWNETPPYLQRYDTSSFPFRHMWITGAIAYLYRIAAESYRKNRLPYSAAGVTVDDQAKAPEYEQASQLRMEEYRRMLRHRKVAMNIANGFGGISSPYSRW